MPKLLWVALPLLLLAAFVAVQAMRRRPPSRRALNVWSSVLLLAYVMATAGLGIFWVANQQLPVFDWHYLFGYATVLLVAIHLTFNFRAVWRYFVGPAAATVDAAPARGGRRGALAALGVLATAGAAFALGLHRGRSEMRSEAAASGTGATAESPSVAERFQAFTSHSRAGVLRSPGLAWIDAPAPFKRYADATRVALPAPGAAPGRPPGMAALGTLLWHTSGVTETRGGLQLRASPSSGALFSTELYVATRSIEGLPAGLWHYDAERHALRRLPGGAADATALGLGGEPSAADAAAVVVATAVFARTGHKYRDRTYRYVLADLGHALENLRQSATAAGMTATLMGAFDEARAAATLALDEVEEGVLAIVALTPVAASRDVLATARVAAAGWGGPAPPRAAAAAGAGTPADVTAAMHAATSLRAGTTSAPVIAARPGAPPASAAKVVLPPATPLPFDVLAVIAGRRSIRRFAPEPITLETLAAVLAAAARDAEPTLSAAVRVSVLALNVAALPAAAYRYESATHGLVRYGGPAVNRAAARAAALDQDVIGDAAAVFVLSVDRALIAGDALGAARGYRHAFLEAGLLGERIYLQAGARRLGACGVGAFYDDEIAALAGIDPRLEWVVHLAALGLPAA